MVSVSGQRRTRVEEYYATIDWSDPAQVRRYLRLVEMILSRDQSDAEQVVATLRLDGYRLDDRGRIVAASDGLLLDAPLEHLADSEVIEQHLARIFAAIDSDPEGAIGASKAAGREPHQADPDFLWSAGPRQGDSAAAGPECAEEFGAASRRGRPGQEGRGHHCADAAEPGRRR